MSPVQYLLQYQLDVCFPVTEVVQILYKDLVVILTPTHVSSTVLTSISTQGLFPCHRGDPDTVQGSAGNPHSHTQCLQYSTYFNINSRSVSLVEEVIQILYKDLLVILTPIHICLQQGYRNFEIQIGPLDRWRHRNMRPTIPNSHEN